MPSDSLAEGYVNMPRQLYGGLKRSLSVGRLQKGKLTPSFIKKVADRYAGEEVMSLTDKMIRINFTPTHFEVIKYSDVMMHPELIEDRIVLLGAMKEETDMHYTPLGKIAGTELLAYGITTMLKHDEVKVISGWPMWVVSFIVVMLITFVRVQYLEFAKKRKIIVRTVLTLGLAVGLVVFSVVAVLMWIAFILFCQYNISFNLGYAIAASAVLPSAINLYDTIVNYDSNK
jgi:CHASE2 domain-containing sensor protein